VTGTPSVGRRPIRYVAFVITFLLTSSAKWPSFVQFVAEGTAVGARALVRLAPLSGE